MTTHTNAARDAVHRLPRRGFAIVALWALVCGCSSEDSAGSGTLTVLIEPEESITQGMTPGDGVEDIRDGWAVSFDKYLMTIGDVRVRFATDQSLTRAALDMFVVDLARVPAGGAPLWSLTDLRPGRWEFSFASPAASSGTERLDGVEGADHERMIAADATHLIEGALEQAEGESCPPAALAQPGGRSPNGNTSGENACYDAPRIQFSFVVAAPTRFGPCQIDEVPGFSMPSGGTQTVSITIHGDHLFFNGFPEGSEGGVLRLSQWLADCDLDLDGVVTESELEAIHPSALPEIDERYQLGGSPVELDDMVDFVVGQLQTQGHFQGEGECEYAAL